MLDLAFIRDHTDEVRRAVREKGDKADIDAILALDAERRKALTDFERLKAEQNARSKRIGDAQRAAAGADQATRLKVTESLAEERHALQRLADDLKTLRAKSDDIQAKLQAALAWVPNVPAADVPSGRTAADNPVVRTWGEPRRRDFKPKAHWVDRKSVV